jgi:hypothetical protein
MAEIAPDEGLDYMIGVLLRAQTQPTTLYVGLFTSQSPTTVPASTAVLATGTGVTELTGTGYARQSITAATWGAPTAGGGGRQTTASTYVTFTAGGTWTAVNGFFVCTTATAGTGIALFYANFDSGVARTLLNGDSLRITPRFALTG